MCGITVRIVLGRSTGSEATKIPSTLDIGALKDQLDRSLDLIAHRGPDAKGIWVGADGSVGLGHCRLSITDLSPAGEQPIHSDDDEVHAVVNGEIYDHERLRDELIQKNGYRFKGHSDSEVVVALYKVYGAPGFFNHLRGEFSLVIYDQRQGRIIAARDRFGIKPLFWTIVNRGGERVLLLAAEAKAFLAMGWKAVWDVPSIHQAGWISDDRTLFRGVKKVMPGYWMEISLSDGQLRRHQYWDAEYPNKRDVETRTVEDMIEGVRTRLIEAVRLRLRADVHIGIYLSGGIDSSLIAGIVTKLVREENVELTSKAKQITCFSIEMPNGSGFDEFDVAKRTADWLGVEITKCTLDEPSLAEHFAESTYHCEHHNLDLNSVGKMMLSAIPRAAGFKVVLTGEGSDEHFAGYPWQLQDFLREPDLSCPDSALTQQPNIRSQMQTVFGDKFRQQTAAMGIGDQRHGWDEENWAYRQINGVDTPFIILGFSYTDPRLLAPWVVNRWSGVDCRETVVRSLPPAARDKMMHQWHPLHSSMYMSTKSTLSNVMLTCLGDRTEMANSIEARPPFLDHDLVEYVNQLPPSLKLQYTSYQKPNDHQEPRLTEKWILREAGKPFISEEVYKRTKQPYLAPIKWTQDGPLYQMFRKLCSKEAVENLGFVKWQAVDEALQTAFGNNANQRSFRLLLCVGGWIVIGQRFGIEKATEADWVDAQPYDPWGDFSSQSC